MNVRSVGLALALVGAALVAHPLYLFPHHGENLYHLSEVETIGDAPPSDEMVAYGDLPPVAQERFETELDGHSDGIWTGEHAAAYEALSDHRYVEYEGEHYEYQFRGAGRLTGASGILRWIMTTLSVISLVTGVFVVRTDDFRPLTPLRTLWIPAGVFVALAATELYDVHVGGAHAPPSYVHLPAMIAALVGASVVGSAAKRRMTQRLPVPALAVGVVALILGLTFGPTDGSLAVGALVFLAVTAPWFILGYALTASPESR